MSVTLTIAGTSYVYPSGTDEEWGSNATTPMQAVASNAIWKDGSVALTGDWDVGSVKITAEQIESDVATGTAPFIVASTTVVSNLNADQVDGLDNTDIVQMTGAQSVAGVKTFTSFPVTPTAAPTTDYQVSNKKYVDDNAGGTPEGTSVLSTGETNTKYLRADGDNSSSWNQVEGTAVASTGEAGGTKYLREDGDGTCSWQAVAGGSKPDLNIDFPAGTFSYPASNPAPLDSDAAGTGEGSLQRQLFDDSTEEFVQGVFQIPNDVNTGGNITFEAYGYAVTADGNEVQLRVGYKALAEGEDWDVAYADSDSGDKTTDAQQDEIDLITWTLAASGFAANDFVRFQLSRIAIADGTPVSGDYGIIHLRIRVPRT